MLALEVGASMRPFRARSEVIEWLGYLISLSPALRAQDFFGDPILGLTPQAGGGSLYANVRTNYFLVGKKSR